MFTRRRTQPSATGGKAKEKGREKVGIGDTDEERQIQEQKTKAVLMDPLPPPPPKSSSGDTTASFVELAALKVEKALQKLFPTSFADKEKRAAIAFLLTTAVGSALILLLLCTLYFGFVSPRHRYVWRNLDWLNHPVLKELLEQEQNPGEGQEPQHDLPKRVWNKRYVVFCTQSKIGDTHGDMTRIAKGTSLSSPYDAMIRACSRHNQHDYDYVKIDVVTSVETMPENSIDARESLPDSKWIMGHYGIALDNWDQMRGDWHATFLPEQVVGQGIIDQQGRFRWDHLGKAILANARMHTGKTLSVPNQQQDSSSWWLLHDSWPVNQQLASKRELSPPTNDDSVTTYPYTVRFFQTKAVFVDRPKEEIVKLFHGHRLYSELTPPILQDAIDLAGSYLIRSVDLKTGRMVYQYWPKSDHESREDEAYSLTRHAGTLYAMALLAHEKWGKDGKNDLLHQAIQSGLSYLKERMVVCPRGTDGKSKKKVKEMESKSPDQQLRCVVEDVFQGRRWTQLGVNALTLLAISEYMMSLPTDSPKMKAYLSDARALADWIVGMQADDEGDGLAGGWVAMEQCIDDGRLKGTESRYYPGEAVFALAKFVNVVEWHQQSKKKAILDTTVWSEAAVRGLLHIVGVQVEDDANFVNDHWAMYAVAETSQWMQSEESENVLRFARRTARIAADRQVREIEDEESVWMLLDRVGIYRNRASRPPDLSATATATKSEGLCAIYPVLAEAVADSHNHSKKHFQLKTLFETIEWGVRYQLQAQTRPEQSIYLKNPPRILGAFGRSVLDSSTRNDYTQHNLSSLLCLKRIQEIRQAQQQISLLGENMRGGNVKKRRTIS